MYLTYKQLRRWITCIRRRKIYRLSNQLYVCVEWCCLFYLLDCVAPKREVPPTVGMTMMRRLSYRVSVKSLFILAILEETERSMVLSPISTINPPRISGLIYYFNQYFLQFLPMSATYLVGHLELLSLAYVGRLGNSILQARESSGIEGL